MTEKQQNVLDDLEKIVPHLSERDKHVLLAFGEGMASATKPEPEQAGTAQ